MTTHTTTLELDGVGPVELTCDRENPGEATPILLLHGGAGPQSMAPFRALLDREATLDVIAPTHPGFGGTPRPGALRGVGALADLYAALLDGLALDGVTVIGNSIGGWIAAELTLRHPRRVSRLILADAVGIAVTGHSVADVASLGLDEILALSFHDPAPFRVDPSTLPAAAQAVAAGNRDALAAYGAGTSPDPTLPERLADVTAPTLVLWGDSDEIVDVAYGRAYASAIPGARFQLLAATGHVPQLETPQHVADVVLDFLQAPTDVQATAEVWSAQHVAETDAPASAVWSALRDLYTGTKLGESSDTIEIHGPVAPGTRLSVVPEGADFTVECEITEVVDERRYAYRSMLAGQQLTSRHTLTSTDGGTRIAHYQEIAGPAATEAAGRELGARITADTPEAMNALIAAAHARTSTARSRVEG